MKYKTLARLLVRGAGLLLIAQTIPACTQTTFTIGVDWLVRDVSRVAGTFWADWRLGYLVDSAVRFGVGMFLFLKPNGIVNLLIPSNRPYCHECGYDLTGSPHEGDCPECGTAYKIEQRRAAVEPPAPPAE